MCILLNELIRFLLFCVYTRAYSICLFCYTYGLRHYNSIFFQLESQFCKYHIHGHTQHHRGFGILGYQVCWVYFWILICCPDLFVCVSANLWLICVQWIYNVCSYQIRQVPLYYFLFSYFFFFLLYLFSHIYIYWDCFKQFQETLAWDLTQAAHVLPSSGRSVSNQKRELHGNTGNTWGLRLWGIRILLIKRTVVWWSNSQA